MENIIDVTEETFIQDVLERSEEVPVVVDFWAPWCGPCRMLSPVLERLASDPTMNFILAKVNVDNNPNLSMQYRVQSIPAVIGFVDGEAVDEFIGVQPEPHIRKFIEQLIPSELDEALSSAQSLLATRHWSQAEMAFRDLLEEQPNRSEVLLNLGRALLAQGEGCEAKELLQRVKDGPDLMVAEKLRPLAGYLCAAAREWADDEKVTGIEVQYRQAARLMSRGNLAAAMDGLLDVLRQDKQYADARQILLGIFALLGDDDELTKAYRTELATVLF